MDGMKAFPWPRRPPHPTRVHNSRVVPAGLSTTRCKVTADAGRYRARALASCMRARKTRSDPPAPCVRGPSFVPAVLREPCDLVCSLRGNLLLRPVDLGSVGPHAMQNDRELARNGDFGLTEPISLGEPHPPSL